MKTNLTRDEIWKLGSLVKGSVKRFIEDQLDHEVNRSHILETIPSLVESVIYKETELDKKITQEVVKEK